jgi:hypothetical protein
MRRAHSGKLRSNKARTQAAEGQLKPGLHTRGELTGMVAKAPVCRGSVHLENVMTQTT